MRVFVLLFNAGTENEGIHTIQAGDRNQVLMFESEDDATRYALMLEAQDFNPPTIEAIDSEEVEGFCSDAGYEAKLIGEGMLALPPERNLEKTDWSPDAKPQAQPSKSQMSDDQLDQIRRQLEGLL